VLEELTERFEEIIGLPPVELEELVELVKLVKLEPVEETGIIIAPPVEETGVVIAPPVEETGVVIAPPVEETGVVIAPPVEETGVVIATTANRVLAAAFTLQATVPPTPAATLIELVATLDPVHKLVCQLNCMHINTQFNAAVQADAFATFTVNTAVMLGVASSTVMRASLVFVRLAMMRFEANVTADGDHATMLVVKMTKRESTKLLVSK